MKDEIGFALILAVGTASALGQEIDDVEAIGETRTLIQLYTLNGIDEGINEDL